jgi:hypothetical protein
MRHLFARTRLEYMGMVAIILTVASSRLFDDHWKWIWMAGWFTVILALHGYRLQRVPEKPVADAPGGLQRD